MFRVNDDLSIYVTRGDIASITVTAVNDGEGFTFPAGSVVRLKVSEKKGCDCVVLQKDFPVEVDSQSVEIRLTEMDTRIGGLISKPKDYWYEIELNPFDNPQTIIGYDEDGAKVFKLFPEGKDLEGEILPEDIPVVDKELDMTSDRPIQNQAVARKFAVVESDISKNTENIKKNADNIKAHTDSKNNPHNVTKAQVGLGNVPNVATNDQTPTYGQADTLQALTSGEKISVAFGKIAKAVKDLIAHLSNKSNPHGVTAAQAGALPITGGTLTGALSVGEKARIWTDTEGGNVRLYSPDGKTTDFWEMDSSDGEKFRIFAYKNATHPNGEGYVMPLNVYSDGSIGVGNATKTRERLGAASENHSHEKSDISDFPSSMPASDVYAWAKASTKPSYTADEVGAINAASVNLANMSVKEWADSVTGTAWAYTNSNTTDMPAEVSAANNYAIATVISVANGGWKELRLNYIVTGFVAVCVYNYGWGEWAWENPPMTVGTEYRTTERYNGKTVFAKAFYFSALGAAYSSVGAPITNGNITVVSMEGIAENSAGSKYPFPLIRHETEGVVIARLLSEASSAGEPSIFVRSFSDSLTAWKASVIVKYTKG